MQILVVCMIIVALAMILLNVGLPTQHRNIMWSALKSIKEGARVLDVGCGPGNANCFGN